MAKGMTLLPWASSNERSFSHRFSQGNNPSLLGTIKGMTLPHWTWQGNDLPPLGSAKGRTQCTWVHPCVEPNATWV